MTIKAKKGFVKSFFTLSFGALIGQIIPFAISPILSRLYSPTDFGQLALISTIASFTSIIATFRLELLFIKNTKEEYEKLLKVTTLLVMLVSALLFFILVAANAIGLIDLSNMITLVLTASTLGGGIQFIIVNSLAREGGYKRLALIQILKAIIVSLISLIMGWYFSNSYGMITGYVAGLIIYIFAFISYKRKKNYTLAVTHKEIKSILYQNKRHITFNLPHAIVNVISPSIPIWLLSISSNPESLGQYSFAYKVALAPLVLISSSMYQIFYRKYTNELNDKKQLIKYMNYLCIFFILSHAAIYPFTVDLTLLIFGNQWAEAGKIIQLFLPWLAIRGCTSPYSFLIITEHKQKEGFYYELIYLTLSSLIFYYCINSFGLREAIIAFSITGLMYSAFINLFYRHLIKSKYYEV